MEKTIDRKVKNRFAIHTGDVVCAGIAAIFGLIDLPIGTAFTFIYLSCCYLRSTRITCISIFFILLCSLSRGILPAYFYALGFAAYFVMIHILKLRNQNLYVWLPYIASFMCAVYSVQAYGIISKAIILPVTVFIVMIQMFQDYTWLNSDAPISKQMISLLVIGGAIVAAQLLEPYKEIILLAAILTAIYLCDEISGVVLIVMLALLIPIHHYDLLFIAGVLCIFKQQKKSAFLILFSACLFVDAQIENYLYLLIAFIGLFVMPKQEKEICVEHESYINQSIIKRQMNNYASIFQLLSDYYKQCNDVQAELLSNMANALQYNADVIRKIEGNESDHRYIQRSLEGYQYVVHELSIDEPKEGCIEVHMELSNIKRGEIRTTLLPLMEVLLHRKLEITHIQSHRFINAAHRISFCDRIPYAIDAYADSIKNSYTSNGDTFSIFRFRQSVVCMISDGMGNGEKAMRSSRLITSIFQRMMVSGIAQDNAIRCINKLIQSDTFATLDVLCFNKAQGVVYISKSAACPTFLLRDKKVYEINGNALPVGIILQMQPDCFQIEYKAGDEYLMVSDGVSMKEINEWMRKRRGISVKDDVDIFSDILKNTRRYDDSTLILAKVDEINEKTG